MDQSENTIQGFLGYELSEVNPRNVFPVFMHAVKHFEDEFVNKVAVHTDKLWAKATQSEKDGQAFEESKERLDFLRMLVAMTKMLTCHAAVMDITMEKFVADVEQYKLQKDGVFRKQFLDKQIEVIKTHFEKLQKINSTKTVDYEVFFKNVL